MGEVVFEVLSIFTSSWNWPWVVSCTPRSLAQKKWQTHGLEGFFLFESSGSFHHLKKKITWKATTPDAKVQQAQHVGQRGLRQVLRGGHRLGLRASSWAKVALIGTFISDGDGKNPGKETPNFPKTPHKERNSFISCW